MAAFVSPIRRLPRYIASAAFRNHTAAPTYQIQLKFRPTFSWDAPTLSGRYLSKIHTMTSSIQTPLTPPLFRGPPKTQPGIPFYSRPRAACYHLRLPPNFPAR